MITAIPFTAPLKVISAPNAWSIPFFVEATLRFAITLPASSSTQ